MGTPFLRRAAHAAEARLGHERTGECEYGLVVLGGICAVRSSRGQLGEDWTAARCFRGMPYAPLPATRNGVSKSTALSPESGPGLWLVRWRQGKHAPRLVTPKDVQIEIRGGGNATRQINSLIPARVRLSSAGRGGSLHPAWQLELVPAAQT